MNKFPINLTESLREYYSRISIAVGVWLFSSLHLASCDSIEIILSISNQSQWQCHRVFINKSPEMKPHQIYNIYEIVQLFQEFKLDWRCVSFARAEIGMEGMRRRAIIWSGSTASALAIVLDQFIFDIIVVFSSYGIDKFNYRINDKAVDSLEKWLFISIISHTQRWCNTLVQQTRDRKQRCPKQQQKTATTIFNQIKTCSKGITIRTHEFETIWHLRNRFIDALSSHIDLFFLRIFAKQRKMTTNDLYPMTVILYD